MANKFMVKCVWFLAEMIDGHVLKVVYFVAVSTCVCRMVILDAICLTADLQVSASLVLTVDSRLFSCMTEIHVTVLCHQLT